MHDVWSVVDPEVFRLVREIAGDPHSSLLRSSAPRQPPDENERGASARQAGLSAAERHLLRAHRGEGAELLRGEVRQRIAHDPRARSLFQGRRPRPPRRRIRQQDRLVARGDSLARTRTYLDAEACRTLRMLRPGREEVKSETLALVAHRLVPSPLTALQLAILACLDERYDDARRLLLPVVQGCLDPELKSYACCNLGLVYSLRGKVQLAVGRYLESSSLLPTWELPLLSAFTNALQLGDERLVRSLVQRIEQQIDPASPSLTEYVDSHVARLRAGGWRPTAASGRLGRGLVGEDSPLYPLIQLFDGMARGQA